MKFTLRDRRRRLRFWTGVCGAVCTDVSTYWGCGLDGRKRKLTGRLNSFRVLVGQQNETGQEL